MTDTVTATPPKKLLISIEDMTPLRGFERIQDLYFVVLGYDISGGAPEAPVGQGNPSLQRVLPDNADLKRWFYFASTPIIQMRKRRRHVFPGGFPLFYGVPGELISFYFAVLESDSGKRHLGNELESIFKDPATSGLVSSAAKLVGASDPQLATIQQAFGLLTKGVETFLINKRDNIRYTNVLTFRSQENYLVGTHTDWGNQRIAFTADVEY